MKQNCYQSIRPVGELMAWWLKSLWKINGMAVAFATVYVLMYPTLSTSLYSNVSAMIGFLIIHLHCLLISRRIWYDTASSESQFLDSRGYAMPVLWLSRLVACVVSGGMVCLTAVAIQATSLRTVCQTLFFNNPFYPELAELGRIDLSWWPMAYLILISLNLYVSNVKSDRSYSLGGVGSIVSIAMMATVMFPYQKSLSQGNSGFKIHWIVEIMIGTICILLLVSGYRFYSANSNENSMESVPSWHPEQSSNRRFQVAIVGTSSLLLFSGLFLNPIVGGWTIPSGGIEASVTWVFWSVIVVSAICVGLAVIAANRGRMEIAGVVAMILFGIYLVTTVIFSASMNRANGLKRVSLHKTALALWSEALKEKLQGPDALLQQLLNQARLIDYQVSDDWIQAFRTHDEVGMYFLRLQASREPGFQGVLDRVDLAKAPSLRSFDERMDADEAWNLLEEAMAAADRTREYSTDSAWGDVVEKLSEKLDQDRLRRLCVDIVGRYESFGIQPIYEKNQFVGFRYTAADADRFVNKYMCPPRAYVVAHVLWALSRNSGPPVRLRYTELADHLSMRMLYRKERSALSEKVAPLLGGKLFQRYALKRVDEMETDRFSIVSVGGNLMTRWFYEYACMPGLEGDRFREGNKEAIFQMLDQYFRKGRFLNKPLRQN